MDWLLINLYWVNYFYLLYCSMFICFYYFLLICIAKGIILCRMNALNLLGNFVLILHFSLQNSRKPEKNWRKIWELWRNLKEFKKSKEKGWFDGNIEQIFKFKANLTTTTIVMIEKTKKGLKTIEKNIKNIEKKPQIWEYQINLIIYWWCCCREPFTTKI